MCLCSSHVFSYYANTCNYSRFLIVLVECKVNCLPIYRFSIAFLLSTLAYLRLPFHTHNSVQLFTIVFTNYTHLALIFNEKFSIHYKNNSPNDIFFFLFKYFNPNFS